MKMFFFLKFKGDIESPGRPVGGLDLFKDKNDVFFLVFVLPRMQKS